jgi:hypothetical protein
LRRTEALQRAQLDTSECPALHGVLVLISVRPDPQRAVAVVVDPIQSVKGKVVIDAFRSINPQMVEPRSSPGQCSRQQ